MEVPAAGGRRCWWRILVKMLRYAAESSLTATLKIMERDGILAIRGGGDKGRPRVISLTNQGRHELGVGGVPLLGLIPAGPLEEAIAQAEEIVEPSLSSRSGDFLLRVHGDSMIGDGIMDGDLVLLRPNVAARGRRDRGRDGRRRLRDHAQACLFLIRPRRPPREQSEVSGQENSIARGQDRGRFPGIDPTCRRQMTIVWPACAPSSRRSSPPAASRPRAAC